MFLRFFLNFLNICVLVSLSHPLYSNNLTIYVHLFHGILLVVFFFCFFFLFSSSSFFYLKMKADVENKVVEVLHTGVDEDVMFEKLKKWADASGKELKKWGDDE